MEKNLSLVDDVTDSLIKKAEVLSKSGILPVSIKGKPADVFAILLMGHELGIGSMQALNSIDCIQGRPTISPQLMIALIRRDCPKAFIKISEENLVCECTMARGTSEEEMAQAYTSVWNMDRARKMGLADKDNYKKQPATMLMWRAVGDAARKVFPDVIKGLHNPDEMIDDTVKVETNDSGEIVDCDNSLVSRQDLQALSHFMRERGYSSEHVKKICIENFKTADATRLQKHQLVRLNEILNANNPEDV